MHSMQAVGQTVYAGSVIALVGNAGASSEPHLHGTVRTVAVRTVARPDRHARPRKRRNGAVLRRRHGRHESCPEASRSAEGVDGKATDMSNRHRAGRAILLLAPALATLAGACGEMPEDGTEQATGAIAEEIIYLERGPCTRCAEIASQIASAEAQARARAMQEAEERARKLRLLAEQKIKACIAEKKRRVAGCENGIHMVAANAAKARTLCELSNPCRTGGAATRRNTCIAQGAIECVDSLNSCGSAIPFGATNVSENAIAAAVGRCYSSYGTATCRDITVTRACDGAGNFGGLGSTIALCEDYLRFNCAEPEAQTLAIAGEQVARCLTDAWAAEQLCLGSPTLTPS
jgi:hypothetical protein